MTTIEILTKAVEDVLRWVDAAVILDSTPRHLRQLRRLRQRIEAHTSWRAVVAAYLVGGGSQ